MAPAARGEEKGTFAATELGMLTEEAASRSPTIFPSKGCELAAACQGLSRRMLRAALAGRARYSKDP